MSKSKEAYMDFIEGEYEQFVESERQELRLEGGEEMRNEIRRIIEATVARINGQARTSSPLEASEEWLKQGLQEALSAVERARI